MSEKRLIDGPLGDDERDVLESIRLDRPSRESARRAAAALGLAPASAWALGGSGWLSAVVVVGAGCLAWFAFDEERESTPPREAAALSTARAPNLAPVVVVAAPPAPPLESEEITPPPAEPSGKGAPASSRVNSLSAAPKRTASEVTGPSALAEQIALLDRARAALAAGRATDALRDLGSYRDRFGGGAFAQEAALLRVQALARAGRGGEAHEEARAFSQKYPKSPHASQVSRY